MNPTTRLTTFSIVCATLGLLFIALTACAGTLYVWQGSPNPSPPYTGWATAATNIQQAIDVAVEGDEIVVTNGVYQTGARAVYGMSNRVAVTKRVAVRSVNGPDVTHIVGYRVPGTTNGPTAVRCVYLTNGAVLTGFTLTNGATQTSGDYRRDSGGGVRCEGLSAVVSNCTLKGNSAKYGGGTDSGTLNNCTLKGNSASYGGGAYGSVLTHCTLTGNSVYRNGGGAYSGTLNYCVLTGNSASFGGGADGGTLNNCTLTGNFAASGGGVNGGTLNNCIVYYNSARYSGANYVPGTFNYCCTTPLPEGPGNLAEEPQLASASHLSVGSPCIGRGSVAYATGVDVDGEPWANPPSIGCDEYWRGSVTGALSGAVVAAYTNVAVGFAVDLQAVIDGRVSAARWDFGDGVVLSNRPWASHAWVAAGDYVVELRAYNESYPSGVAATVTVHVVQEEHYVALTSVNPVPPYSSWATAATNIQDAVDAAVVPGAQVWVSDGVYRTGARAMYGMSNRVAVTQPVTVRSVNGPDVTQIVGYRVPGTTNGPAAVRCVYLTNGAALAGFTLTNGATQTAGTSTTNGSGGGVWCEGLSTVVSNCVLTGNSAYWYGGGVCYGTLDHCVLTGNSAYQYGGGASSGALNDCVLTGNSASIGGGAYSGTLNHCTLTGNSALIGGGADSGTLNHCMLTGNSASAGGGGACYGTLNYCTLAGNSSYGGGGADRCTLNCCTLTGNSGFEGGGAHGGTLNNCTLTYNSANYWGGGASEGTLSNCTLAGNSASRYGGGAYKGTLNNCTLTGNLADSGGGAYYGTLSNCIVYYNDARYNDANYIGGTLNYCCTTPPLAGTGNLANVPSFVNTNDWSNLRLQTNSPCINAGNNAYTSGTTDLDGNPRIAGGTVDMGAYEFQTPASQISYAWLQQYALPTDGSADATDSDGDTRNNWQEWRCDTDPTNAASVLRLLAPVFQGNQVSVSWPSVPGLTYFLERSTDLSASPVFQPLATNLPGQAGVTTYLDTNAPGLPPRFYRVGVSY